MFKFKQNSIVKNVSGIFLIAGGIRLTMPSWYVLIHGPLNLLFFIGSIICFISAFFIFVDFDKFAEHFINNYYDDEEYDEEYDDEDDE